jgi:hypothetical protein
MFSWNRPQLPEAYRVNMVTWGAGILMVGIVALMAGLSMAANAAESVATATRYDLSYTLENAQQQLAFGSMVSILGYGCVAVGPLLMVLGVVIREIRQAAFEAAIRAGEAPYLTAASPAPQPGASPAQA